MAIWAVSLFLGLLLTTDGALGQCDSVSCPSGWSEYGLRCFKFFKSEVTWKNAETECVNHGGHLASVHSSEENAFVHDLIKEVAGTTLRSWLGGSDTAKEGIWLWSNALSTNYQNWGPDEPSNTQGIENCLEINFGAPFKWNDDECSKQKPFVCVRNLK